VIFATCIYVFGHTCKGTPKKGRSFIPAFSLLMGILCFLPGLNTVNPLISDFQWFPGQEVSLENVLLRNEQPKKKRVPEIEFHAFLKPSPSFLVVVT